MSTHPKVATPIVDQYRDKFIDLRARFLASLEVQIRDQEIDTHEALHILAATLLMDLPKARAYISALSEAPELWKFVPEKRGPGLRSAQSALISGFGKGGH